MSPSEIATALRWRLASDIETELVSHARVAERVAALQMEHGERVARLQVALVVSMAELVLRLRLRS
jgi:hypothetical protein